MTWFYTVSVGTFLAVGTMAQILICAFITPAFIELTGCIARQSTTDVFTPALAGFAAKIVFVATLTYGEYAITTHTHAWFYGGA